MRVDIKDPEVLILTKYFRNAYLATKVAFFNQINDMAKRVDVDHAEVLMNVSDDPRIGKSNTYVNEDDRGFGGHCFPKDTTAIVHSAKKAGYNLSLISEAISYNKGIRE